MKQFKEYTGGQRQLIPPNPDELISESDLVRTVERVLNKVDKSLLPSPLKSNKGQPPYHPVMMMKLPVYAYARRIYSCRKMEDAVRHDIRFIRLCDYHRPDYKTINRFRGEYFKDILEQVFAQTVEILLEEGRIKGKDIPDGNDADDSRNGLDCAGIREKAAGQ